MTSSNNLTKVRGIIARVLRTKSEGKMSINFPLTVDHYNKADKMMAWLSLPETTELLRKSSLANLSPFIWEGLPCTRGRLGKSGTMSKLGHKQLIIISPKSPLAKLLMIQAHNEDHR